MTHLHPKKDERGRAVRLVCPSTPTPLDTWNNAKLMATVTPLGAMPDALYGVVFAPWDEAPDADAAWAGVPGQNPGGFDEPAFVPAPGMKSAAGVVIEEADGRVWVVHPSNAFGRYPATFPKGRVEPGVSLRATAIKEAFEEAGLQVELTGFLADANRSQTRTRYYLARRVGGMPSDMCWESQGVSLVPCDQLGQVLTNENDEPLIKALMCLRGLAPQPNNRQQKER